MESRARCVTRGIVALVMLLAFGTLALPRFAPHPGASPAAGTHALPTDLLPVVNTTLGMDDPAYAIVPTPGDPTTVMATNAAQDLTATFAPDGVRVGGTWGLRFTGLGYGAGQAAMTQAAPVAVGNRVEYRRGTVTEWYVNGPAGLEQGFTLAAPPPGSRDGELTLTLAVAGAMLAPDRAGLTVTPAAGETLRYGHLAARDATGRSLPAWLTMEEAGIRIVVGDGGAEYPVVVDPLIQTAKLTASDGAVSDEFGYSVAVSGDGSTAVIGALGKNSFTGAVYVFVRSGGTWSQQQKLTAGDAAAGDAFGDPVAVSGDGNTAVIGALGKSGNTGAAYVFVRSGGTWSQQQELTAGDAAAGDQFGTSVAVSADGATAVIGAFGKSGNTGAAYVFVRSGGTWSQQQKLTAGDAATNDRFGFAVAVSADGATAVIGAFGKSSLTGAVYVFVHSGGTWSQQQELTAGDAVGGDQFGYSVAVSGDGNTAVIGALGKNSFTGAVYVFVRSGGVWSQQQELTAGDAVGGDRFGVSVGMSGDGNTTVIGADGKNSNTGAAYVFVRSGGTWSQQQKLTASDGAASDFLGISVAVSGDGATAVIGAYGKNSNTGAAYVFPTHVIVSPLAGTTPQSAAVGAAFPTALAVHVTDSAGYPVNGAAVTFSAPGSGASGTFVGGVTSATATTDASGNATAPTFTANASEGNYVVTVTTFGQASAPFSLTNLSGGATTIVATTGSNQSATVGAAFATGLRATVLDTHNNPVSGVSVTFAAPGSGASGAFTGSATVTTDSNGVAIAPTFTANTTAGTYTVTATAIGVTTPASFTLTNKPGPAASLAVAGFPASTVAGVAYTFTVTAKDASGNTVPTYTGTVSFGSNDGAATLPATYPFQPSDNGTHTFTATLKTVGSGRTLVATDSGNSVSGTQSGIAVTPAVTAVSPISGPQTGGNPITITGIGLTGATSVTLGGAACTGINVNGAGTSLTCTAPTNQPVGTVDVTVTTPNGIGTLTHGYTFLPAFVAPSPGGSSRGGGGGGGGGGNTPGAVPASR